MEIEHEQKQNEPTQNLKWNFSGNPYHFYCVETTFQINFALGQF